MICVNDNFLEKEHLEDVISSIHKMEYFSCEDNPNKLNKLPYGDFTWTEKYPGKRTIPLEHINTKLCSSIMRAIERCNFPFTNKAFKYNQTANVRLKKDNNDFIHQDGSDWAYMIYLSETNLESGTKFYLSENEDEEYACTKFLFNRLVVFDSRVYHKCWNSYGDNPQNGRISINGFCTYTDNNTIAGE